MELIISKCMSHVKKRTESGLYSVLMTPRKAVGHRYRIHRTEGTAGIHNWSPVTQGLVVGGECIAIGTSDLPISTANSAR